MMEASYTQIAQDQIAGTSDGNILLLENTELITNQGSLPTQLMFH